MSSFVSYILFASIVLLNVLIAGIKVKVKVIKALICVVIAILCAVALIFAVQQAWFDLCSHSSSVLLYPSEDEQIPQSQCCCAYLL